MYKYFCLLFPNPTPNNPPAEIAYKLWTVWYDIFIGLSPSHVCSHAANLFPLNPFIIVSLKIINPPDNKAAKIPNPFTKSDIFIWLITVIIITTAVTIIAALAWFCTLTKSATIGMMKTNGFIK